MDLFPNFHRCPEQAVVLRQAFFKSYSCAALVVEVLLLLYALLCAMLAYRDRLAFAAVSQRECKFFGQTGRIFPSGLSEARCRSLAYVYRARFHACGLGGRAAGLLASLELAP